MKLLITVFLATMASTISSAQQQDVKEGAWLFKGDGQEVVVIFADGFYSSTTFNVVDKTFAKTRGGKYKRDDDNVVEVVEFDTADPAHVGTELKSLMFTTDGALVDASVPGTRRVFKRLDDGGPGKLAGAWVITGRVTNGEINRRTPGARRTMKILSGTRFQWIAYNVETKEFSGTGGGTYSTVDGKYTENIEFFSRDSSRVGASLAFDFAIEEGEWRHSGLSSKGEPLNEIWSKRSSIGL